MKTTKESVAIVITNEKGEFLTVRRAGDDTFPGQWGLPAASLRSGETNEDTAKRAAKDKLGVNVEVLDVIGDMTVDKGDYFAHLTEYHARIIEGKPVLKARDQSVSQYESCKYSSDPAILVPAAQQGSLCSRIYLKEQGINW